MSAKTLADAPGVSDPPEELRPRFTFGALRRAPHTGLIAVLIVVVVATALRTDSFATTTNLINVLRQVSVTAVIAAGLTLLMTAGGMDFSMGSNVSVTTAVGAQLLSHGHSTAFTVIASVLLATAIGLVNGLVVTFTNVAPFVATLATATLLDGVALLVQGGLSVSIGTRMFSLGVEEMERMAPYHFAVEVDDWDEFLTHLKELGIRHTRPIERPENQSKFCYIHDPDHTMIELVFHGKRPN